METHPSYPKLSFLLNKYPAAAGSLFQAYNDIVFAQQWTDVEVLELEGCSRAVIKGRRPNMETISHVVPCSLAETVSFSWLKTAFSSLSNPPEIHLGITTDDASIVYYKISLGIVKPSV